MGDLPYPPKLKLTPHQRALLAGELYPPDEPYEQPLRLDEETRQRNLQGIEDARAALHRVTEHNIPVPQKPEYVDEREHVTGQRTGRKVLKNPPAYEKPPPPPPPPPSPRIHFSRAPVRLRDLRFWRAGLAKTATHRPM